MKFNPLEFMKKILLFILGLLKKLRDCLWSLLAKWVSKLDTWIWNKRWNKNQRNEDDQS